MGEKMRRLRSTNWKLQNSHGDVKYCIGNIVNNIVITMDGVRWVVVLSGRLLKLYKCLIIGYYT